MLTNVELMKIFFSVKLKPMTATDLEGFAGIEGNGFIGETEDEGYMIVADVMAYGTRVEFYSETDVDSGGCPSAVLNIKLEA